MLSSRCRFAKEQRQIAINLKLLNTHLYKQVEDLAGISKSTLSRSKRKVQVVKK
ncbi:hypothetical protein J7E77_07600 [Bacillus sp. ISL-77]|nr:hypothetical protein [Bacillus sp. ISL-77]